MFQHIYCFCFQRRKETSAWNPLDSPNNTVYNFNFDLKLVNGNKKKFWEVQH